MMLDALANIEDAGRYAAGGAVTLIVSAIGLYIARPGWLYAGDRAKAAEQQAAADASAADRARAAHLDDQTRTIADLQRTIATMQANQSEAHKDQVAQAKQIGKLEARIGSVERQNDELKAQLGERIRERDAAVAERDALQHVIDEKSAAIVRHLDSNSELMLDLDRITKDRDKAETLAAHLRADLDAATTALAAAKLRIDGLEQSVRDLQHTLNPQAPLDCPPVPPVGGLAT